MAKSVNDAALHQFKILERERIHPSPLNPRKNFDPDKLEELAGTMANGVGIIEPLVVRPLPHVEGLYEVVAGERRWRAAAIAGLAEVPVVVKELTDAQVLEIMVIENNQREDVSPLEEADGFRRLLEMGAVSGVDALSDRLGRSKKYVYDRIKLLDLVPEGQELLDAGRITAGHGILLARLKPADQRRALDPGSDAVFEHETTLRDHDHVIEGGKAPQSKEKYAELKAKSVRELEHWIARHVRFNVDHFAQAAPLDFGDTALAVEQAAARPGRGKKVAAITFEYVAPQGIRDEKERTYGAQSWKHADGVGKNKSCDHSVLGVVAGGVHYGRTFEVCVARDKCDVHWKAERQAKEKGMSGAAAAAKQSQWWQEKQRHENEKEAAAQKTWAAAVPHVLSACVEKLKVLSVDGLVVIIFDDYCTDDPKTYQQALEHLPGGAVNADRALRALALMCVLRGVRAPHSYGRDRFKAFAKKHLKVDVGKFLNQEPAPKRTASTKLSKAAKAPGSGGSFTEAVQTSANKKSRQSAKHAGTTKENKAKPRGRVQTTLEPPARPPVPEELAEP